MGGQGRAKALGMAILAFAIVCAVLATKPMPIVTAESFTEQRSGDSKAEFDLSPVEKEETSSVQRREIGGVSVLMERPANPKGILFVAHGCHHNAEDWWPSTPDVCPECIGLPEELAIVKMALEFELAVVAVSSDDRVSKCWSGTDGPIVAKVLTALEEEILETDQESKVPILAFGASSGGGFVGRKLIKSMRKLGRDLDGFIAQIAAPDSRSELPKERGEHPFPIATFITMNRDVGSDEHVREIVEGLQQEGHPAKHTRLPPLALSHTFFQDRIPHYTLEQSKTMTQALRKSNFLDESTFELNKDPRRSTWRDVLKEHVACPPDCLVADQSPVSEVMNVAWGAHEMARDGVRESIAFILREHAQQGTTQGSSSFGGLTLQSANNAG
ncbi:expressed unknown protein [Seminavis robusta]|uniref:Uncharacterized protein n=1 Tax=Seminavis robusta TaxID=568900 RepID=A0A9N8HSC1_9STRA|nr:expressed unknown protein [Seminavis robusta]|eukprot:Sro1503_g278030.1 n/a (387) ;mRNA; f:12026-13186